MLEFKCGNLYYDYLLPDLSNSIYFARQEVLEYKKLD